MIEQNDTVTGMAKARTVQVLKPRTAMTSPEANFTTRWRYPPEDGRAPP